MYCVLELFILCLWCSCPETLHLQILWFLFFDIIYYYWSLGFANIKPIKSIKKYSVFLYFLRENLGFRTMDYVMFKHLSAVTVNVILHVNAHGTGALIQDGKLGLVIEEPGHLWEKTTTFDYKSFNKSTVSNPNAKIQCDNFRNWSTYLVNKISLSIVSISLKTHNPNIFLKTASKFRIRHTRHVNQEVISRTIKHLQERHLVT